MGQPIRSNQPPPTRNVSYFLIFIYLFSMYHVIRFCCKSSVQILIVLLLNIHCYSDFFKRFCYSLSPFNILLSFSLGKFLYSFPFCLVWTFCFFIIWCSLQLEKDIHTGWTGWHRYFFELPVDFHTLRVIGMLKFTLELPPCQMHVVPPYMIWVSNTHTTPLYDGGMELVQMIVPWHDYWHNTGETD